MNKIVPRFAIALFVLGLLIIPVFGSSIGPSALNQDEELTVKYGCNCHNNGASSPRVIVMITGVPIMYELSETYNLTVTVADSLTLSGGEGNVKAGFLLSSGAVGIFSWDENQDIRQAEDRPDDISHSKTDSDGIWNFRWTAPSENIGQVNFWLAGNSVDGGGIPDEYDYWNLVSFSISEPGSITTTESDSTLQTRTISVGDYDSLFVLEVTEEQLEQERQDELSHKLFKQGNFFFWTSLVALIVGGVFQREILERRYDEGPEYLARELAIPQAIRRSIGSILTFVMAYRWAINDAVIQFPPPSIVGPDAEVTDLTVFIIGSFFFISAWFAYGVYRTILAANSEPKVKDIL
ncbi:MAG: choice-of-anchor V domain-containing protein [Candidatus Thalassarchaeaceae archaeon]